MKITKNMVFTPSAEARELLLYTENCYSLYTRFIRPVMKNLQKKIAVKKYDSEEAIKLWYYVTTEASKQYKKDFGYRFTVTERWTAAVNLRDDFEASEF